MNKIITIYELLGLIKDGKAPKRIIFDTTEYKYGCGYYYRIDNEVPKIFTNEYNIFMYLNEEVEILEENKPIIEKLKILEENKPIIEKLKIKDNKVIGKWENGSDYHYTLSAPQVVIINKINEVIDYLNKKEDKNN